jgi:hypothetical protein
MSSPTNPSSSPRQVRAEGWERRPGGEGIGRGKSPPKTLPPSFAYFVAGTNFIATPFMQ